MKTLSIYLFVLGVAVCTATGYGRNKVQVERRDWWEIDGRHFTVYYPVGAEAPAETLLVYAERELRELSLEFNYLPEEPIPIVLYISPAAFRQTNINPYEIPQAVGGFTEFMKGRVVIPFTGYWSEFRHVVAHEINHAFVFDMLYHRSLLDIIKGGTPLWMMEGLAEYTSLGWDRASEAEFRDMVIANNIVSLGELSRRGDYLVYRQGQAVYHFMVERYGREKFREFVKRIDSATSGHFTTGNKVSGDPFKTVFGMSEARFSEKFIEWARETYWSQLNSREGPGDLGNPIMNGDKRIVQANSVISPDGNLVAGVEWYHARLSVAVRSTVTGEVVRRPFVSGGLEDISVSPLYKVCSFSPGGDSLVIAVQHVSGDRLLVAWDDGSCELPLEMDLIKDPAWSPSGRYIAFSALEAGRLDLYLWDLKEGVLSGISDDARGERDLSWSGDSLLYVTENLDCVKVVEYLPGGGSRTLLEDSSEVRYPIMTEDGLLFLSDADGYPNLYLQGSDGRPRRLTSLYRIMESPSYAASADVFTFVASDWGGRGVFLVYDVTGRRPPEGRSRNGTGDTWNAYPVRPVPAPLPGEGEDIREESTPDMDEEQVLTIAPYSPALSVDYARALASYDSYLGVAGYTQIILSDVLSHHRVAVVTNLNGGSLSDADVAATYGYYPCRTDYIFGLMRDSHRYLFKFEDGHYEEVRDVDKGGFVHLRYPLSPSFRLGGTMGYRRLSRKGIWNSTVDVNVDIFAVRAGVVYDDALWGAVGPRVGSRMSVLVDFAPGFSGTAEYLTFLADLRRYTWVSSQVTLAMRLAGGSSWGKDGQVFFLGGALPHRLIWGKVNTIEELLGFYTNYGDMLRGFDYADIQGRRYGVLGLEMRVPFVKTLSLAAPVPITLRNGRGVLFVDMGTAFDEFSKFRGASTSGGYHLEDLKMGIGLGYRFNLGYFLFKHDIAWRTDLGGISRKPSHFITLGAEF